MDTMTILLIIEKVLKYGIEPVMRVIAASGRSEWTRDQIRALEIVDDPESFFK